MNRIYIYRPDKAKGMKNLNTEYLYGSKGRKYRPEAPRMTRMLIQDGIKSTKPTNKDMIEVPF